MTWWGRGWFNCPNLDLSSLYGHTSSFHSGCFSALIGESAKLRLVCKYPPSIIGWDTTLKTDVSPWCTAKVHISLTDKTVFAQSQKQTGRTQARLCIKNDTFFAHSGTFLFFVCSRKHRNWIPKYSTSARFIAWAKQSTGQAGKMC